MAVAVGIVLVAWLMALAVALLHARSDLTRAQQALFAGRRALQQVDLPVATEHFTAARGAVRSAELALGAAHVRAAAAVPFLGRSLTTTSGLAGGARGVADAGLTVTEAMAELPGGLAALAPSGGGFPVEPLERLAPALRSAERSVARAVALVDATPRTGLLAPVAAARARFLDLAEPLAHQTAAAAALTERLPAFLGSGAPRRYFLGAANPAEVRGTGGYIGAFAVVTMDGGRVDIGAFDEIQSLENLPLGAVPPPNPDYATRYDPYGGPGYWRSINMTPDFPSAASAIERLWEATQEQALDGTIVVDPFAFEAMLRIAGPVEVPGVGRMNADRVVDYVSNEAYAELTDPEERKRLLGAVAATSFEGFLTAADAGRARRSVEALASLVSGGHLLLHSAHDDEQAAFEMLGVDGRLLDPAGDFLSVVLNSGSATKLDYYLERSVSYDVELLEGGAADGLLELTLHNAAPPSGMPPYVIGPGVPSLEAGEALSLVSLYAATGATIIEAPVEAGALDDTLQTELGHPVVGSWHAMASGGEQQLTYRVRTPDAWTQDGELVTYRFTYQHQTTIPPTRLRLTVAVPEGTEVRSMPRGATVRDGRVVVEDEAQGDLAVEVTFGLPAPDGTWARLTRLLSSPLFS
jgi:hypothetical protein